MFISLHIHTHKTCTNSLGTVKLLSSIFQKQNHPHFRRNHKQLISHSLRFNICLLFKHNVIIAMLCPCLCIKVCCNCCHHRTLLIAHLFLSVQVLLVSTLTTLLHITVSQKKMDNAIRERPQNLRSLLKLMWVSDFGGKKAD